VRNGDESDLDCGGDCPLCAAGQSCAGAGDCRSGVCDAQVCAAPACADGVRNGDETDVDCGGPCGACADGLGCAVAGDCRSGVCEVNTCRAPRCGDGVANGQEACDDGNEVNVDGCLNDCTNNPNQAPNVVIDCPPAATVGQAVRFNSMGSSDPDGTIAAIRWDLGDGTVESGAPFDLGRIEHTYDRAGEYIVTLTVTDDGERAAEASCFDAWQNWTILACENWPT